MTAFGGRTNGGTGRLAIQVALTAAFLALLIGLAVVVSNESEQASASRAAELQGVSKELVAVMAKLDSASQRLRQESMDKLYAAGLAEKSSRVVKGVRDPRYSILAAMKLELIAAQCALNGQSIEITTAQASISAVACST